MQTKPDFIIGTRGSLLATTQCSLIKEELEKLSGKTFELKLIKTQGDQITNAPLWQLEGKDFFTKELDEALLSGSVDMVVHSYKDLGSERPQGIELASITKRKYSHDILLIKKTTVSKLKDLKTLNVGTSSPRRITNLKRFLNDFMPADLEIETSILRGNVNTRIQKLKDDHYDAIVLALAGLERLAMRSDSKKILSSLLNGLTYSVLPLSRFPTAASQGALAIECRGNRTDDLKEILKKVHDDLTAKEVHRERKAFQSYGGGCHLAVGISAKSIENDCVVIHQGEHEDQIINKIEQESLKANRFKGDIFLGMPKVKISEPKIGVVYDEYVQKDLIDIDLPNHQNYFVTSTYCLDALERCNPKIVFVSGVRTWKKTVQRGIWVNGSADAFGEDEILNLKNSLCLNIFTSLEEINILTNDQSSSLVGKTIAIYTRKELPPSEEYVKKLKQCTAFYWSSYYQYKKFIDLIPEIRDKEHACGLGKTLKQFKKHGVKVTPYYQFKDFMHLYEK